MKRKRVYRIPSMKDVSKKRTESGLTLVSTFSGCGGSCLGFEMAGILPLWASEFIAEARDVYARNHAGVYLDERDIRKVTPKDILKATGLVKGELDIFEGSPPCAGFSTAGKREQFWGKEKSYSNTKQVVDDLFFEYCRILKGLQPRAFVAENVKGLAVGKARGYFKQIAAALRKCGYQVKAKLLDARWLGVPQQRERVIFIGIRNDLGVEPEFPKPSIKVPFTLTDAWRGLDQSDEYLQDWAYWPGEGTQLLRWLKATPPGESLQLAAETFDGKSQAYTHRRLRMDRPCCTLGQGTPDVYHPERNSTLSIAECARASSFPDDFEFTGSFHQRWERIGRSVPPLMMRAIGQAVRSTLEGL